MGLLELEPCHVRRVVHELHDEVAALALPRLVGLPHVALPYVVTIIVLTGAIGRAAPPASIGQSYERSR
jgi:hypothetical protein